MVIVLSELPVELPQLRRAFDAPSRGLLDVDVREAFVVGVLLDVEVDICEADGFALEPADALEGEDGVGVVGERLVLWGSELPW